MTVVGRFNREWMYGLSAKKVAVEERWALLEVRLFNKFVSVYKAREQTVHSQDQSWKCEPKNRAENVQGSVSVRLARGMWTFYSSLWSLPYLLTGYYLYFAQHTANVFARETRSLVRENETKEKTLLTATTLQLLLGEGQVERNQEFALTQRNPNKNHQHQIRNALSYVERNQLLIWLGTLCREGLFCKAMNLFSLYVLFSHCRQHNVSPENSFFQISRLPPAYACMTNWKTKGQFPWEHHVVWIGDLHDDVILLLRPESFRVLLSCAN